MVHLDGESSNALFDTLEDWNKALSHQPTPYEPEP